MSGIFKSCISEIIVVEDTEVNGVTKIANEFNNFFTNVGPELTQKTPQLLKRFEIYENRVKSEVESKPITVDELK